MPPYGTGRWDSTLLGAFLEQELEDRQDRPKHFSWDISLPWVEREVWTIVPKLSSVGGEWVHLDAAESTQRCSCNPGMLELMEIWLFKKAFHSLFLFVSLCELREIVTSVWLAAIWTTSRARSALRGFRTSDWHKSVFSIGLSPSTVKSGLLRR